MTKTSVKKASKKKAAKKAAAPALKGNIGKLTAAGVIPAGYKKLTPGEKTALEGLTAGEVKAIIAAKTKMGAKFFPKHASHGMLY